MSIVAESKVTFGNLVYVDPIDTLRNRIEGQVITAADFEFDEARKTKSLVNNAKPVAIVHVKSADDVAAVVKFAQRQELPLAVRSGGHSLAHYSVVDRGLTIDFSLMKQVVVDPVSKTARVQAGATSGDLINESQKFGLALTTGDTQTVGIGGLTTGGGIGFMVRKFGLTIDNLLAAQVVLSDGRIVTASKESHADLFWAIRGGGGNFGVITEFTFKLAEVSTVLGGVLILPATKEVIRGYMEYSATAPEDLTTIGNLMYAPPAPFIPEEKAGELVFLILTTWTGSIEEGEKAVAPLRALATPIADTLMPMPYAEMYRYTDAYGEPHAASIRMMFADEVSDESIDAALAAMANPTSPYGLVQIRGLGGAMVQVSPEATAFAHRNQKFFFAIINVWLDPSEDAEVHGNWTQALWQQVRQDGRGVYVNFLEREGMDRVLDAYPAKTFDRLADVKAKYDPENLFRNNQNIPPRQ